jgi:hypothetical protein
MRTTLSLDPDVVALIEREVDTTKKTMKSVINDKLRRGFAVRADDDRLRGLDLPQALNLGQPKVQNFDNIAEILELIQDDSR